MYIFTSSELHNIYSVRTDMVINVYSQNDVYDISDGYAAYDAYDTTEVGHGDLVQTGWYGVYSFNIRMDIIVTYLLYKYK